jgi:hypothetical protein
MEHSSPWEANRSSASPKIPHILWNPKIHYDIHNTLPTVPILNQISSVHGPHPTSWRSTSILSSNLRQALSSGIFPPGFSTKTLYALLSPRTRCSPRAIHASWFDHPNAIWWGVQIIMQSSSLPCYLVSLKSKYLPHHPITQIYNFTIGQCYIISHSFQIRALSINNPVTEYYLYDPVWKIHWNISGYLKVTALLTGLQCS